MFLTPRLRGGDVQGFSDVFELDEPGRRGGRWRGHGVSVSFVIGHGRLSAGGSRMGSAVGGVWVPVSECAVMSVLQREKGPCSASKGGRSRSSQSRVQAPISAGSFSARAPSQSCHRTLRRMIASGWSHQEAHHLVEEPGFQAYVCAKWCSTQSVRLSYSGSNGSSSGSGSVGSVMTRPPGC